MKKDDVYRALKKKILDEDLVPGQWLVERDISDTYRISRTPVREILRILVADGLVTMEASKGYSVKKLSIEEIVEIFQAREAVEGLAARLCCLKGDEGFFSHVEELRARFTRIDLEKDSSQGVILGDELHSALVNAANNSLLVEFYEKLRNLAALTRNITKRSIEIEENSRRGHLEITEAILERNAVRSEQCMRNHINGTCRLLTQSYLTKRTGFIDNNQFVASANK
ncbi:MAG: GntR family transcriptional regulator [Deltaproteobacteria bacterium]|nr:GntR family transcriptional regulator [Deltaproteobacteria bacterium]MBW2136717.1 GntR family transcriptional regulator [Deltaproteobacteria bacterium]